MRNVIFSTSLFIALATAGCGNSQLHQSLLMHENRRLEDALYVSHAQIAELQRENSSLRKQQKNEADLWNEDIDIMPPFEMPKVILPSTPGTSEVPESMRGSQRIPDWRPIR